MVTLNPITFIVNLIVEIKLNSTARKVHQAWLEQLDQKLKDMELDFHRLNSNTYERYVELHQLYLNMLVLLRSKELISEDDFKRFTVKKVEA